MHDGRMATITTRGEAAQRVLAALKAEDRTVTWLARRAGIPRSTLRYQLDNPNRLTVENLLRIANALGRPVEEMVAA